MSNVIGFLNKEEKEHRLTNELDGKLVLNVYVDTAVGKTDLSVNGSVVAGIDAGAGMSPAFLGTVSLPRGEFVLSVSAAKEPEKILLGKDLRLETPEDFSLAFANRKGQWVFEREKPQYTPKMLADLRRHGFLYEEPEDCAVGKMPSGIPLGGMGAGKLDITEDGLFTAFTGNNNQDCPLYCLPGSFLAVSDGENVRVLHQHDMGQPFTGIESAVSDHEFPFAHITFRDSALPFSAELKAFSPHIPHNPDDSALPCIFFDVTLTGEREGSYPANLCFSWENIINVGGSMNVTNTGDRVFPMCFHTWNGSFVWSDRTVNHTAYKDRMLRFYADDDRKNPMSFGEHILCCDDPGAEAVPDRSILPEAEKSFAAYLADGKDYTPDRDSEFRAGALIVRKKLTKGKRVTVRFVLTWYMPTLPDGEGVNHGVYYTTLFDSAEKVLRYALANRERLEKETREVGDILHRSSLPAWFVRRMLDDRFPVATCSWFDKAGNFSINEAPTGMGGCLGTLDQRTASQPYYTAFFPELDARELDLFRRSQAADGMCAHEIGFAGIKLWARPFSKWPDLVASYIIQVYHHYQRTGDLAMLKKHFPHIEKGIAWTLSFDDLKLAVPALCAGRGTTFDNQFWEGITSFITTMQIAAFRIGAACAGALGETEKEKEWEALVLRADEARQKYLWMEKEGYFRNAYNPANGDHDDSCFMASLAGDWAEERAGVGSFLDREKLGRVAGAITRECIGDHGLTDQGGRRDTTDGFTQYSLAYLGAAALYGGNTEAAWRVASTTETVITQPGVSNHYNQALTFSYAGKRYGLPYYMTAPASWNYPEAMLGLRADVYRQTLSLSPAGEGYLRLPVFLPDAWFEVIRPENGDTLTLLPVRSFAPLTLRTLKVRGRWEVKGMPCRYENGYTVLSLLFDPGVCGITLQKFN